MFQDTQQRTDRGRQQGNDIEKAGDLTDSMREKLREDAPTEKFEVGKLVGQHHPDLDTVRAGVSSGKIQQEAVEAVMPTVDRELSKLEPPLARDDRWKVKEEVRQAITRHAAALDSEKVETLAGKPDEEREG